MNNPRPKRPVSDSLEGGFFACRRARVPVLPRLDDTTRNEQVIRDVFDRLAAVAVHYPGTDLFVPYKVHRPQQAVEVRSVERTDIIRNADVLGHLGRQAVYQAIEERVATFHDSATVVVSPKSLKARDGHHRPAAKQWLSISLNDAQLGRERTDIRDTLAELAEVPASDLKWAVYSPLLDIAHFSLDTAEEAHEAMSDVIRQSPAFHLSLAPGILLPQLNPDLPG